MNLSRSGPSLTLGVRGAHVTVGTTGTRKTLGIPGTGVYYASRQGHHTGYHSAKSDVLAGDDARSGADRKAERVIAAVLLAVAVIVAFLPLR
jgi:hypothetical protein